MTEQDLLDANYHRSANEPFALRWASHFYQRAIMEDDKKAVQQRLILLSADKFSHAIPHGQHIRVSAQPWS